ncbi:hypothetical protein SALBM311S_09104 [Streptomyces alboniger]
MAGRATPLLNAAVYFFIFGVIHAGRGMPQGRVHPVPGHGRLRLHVHPELGDGGRPRDLRQPRAGPRAALPARLALARYETYDDLLAYCELSANPVGRLVLAVTGTSTPERIRRSDAICTALQIVEHLQDVAEDLGRDRVYLPAEDMKRFHVQETDLAAKTGGASVRALVAYEAQRARDLLNGGAPLVGSVHGRLKLLLAGFVAGGRAALRAIAAAEYDVLPGPPKPGKLQLLREVGVTLRGEG